jgi:predicted membrane-bound mannosyltransferase
LIFTLAVVGAIAGFKRSGLANGSRALIRTIAFYTIILTAIYTVIPYKTPWCALGFWHGAILLAGVGAVELVNGCRRQPLRFVVGAALIVGALHLGWQSCRAAFTYSASQFNPHVYAHTSPDLLKLVTKVEALARLSPAGHDTVVKVMSPANDYWPLPWYLRQFKRSGWWNRIPADPLAPIMIVSSKFEAAFDSRPEKTHLMAGYFQLRPQVFLELYVDLNLWREYVKTLPPEKD